MYLQTLSKYSIKPYFHYFWSISKIWKIIIDRFFISIDSHQSIRLDSPHWHPSINHSWIIRPIRCVCSYHPILCFLTLLCCFSWSSFVIITLLSINCSFNDPSICRMIRSIRSYHQLSASPIVCILSRDARYVLSKDTVITHPIILRYTYLPLIYLSSHTLLFHQP